MQVTTGSRAAKAGIRAGDVIVAADGQPIRDETDVVRALTSHNPGDVISVVLRRDGTTITVAVTLAVRPS